MAVNTANAQASAGKFNDYIVLPTKDTVYMERTAGDFWYGFGAGANGTMGFGELKMPWKPFNAYDPVYNPILTYNPEKGLSYHAGVFAEWLPIEKFWGARLDLYFMDSRFFISATDSIFRDFPQDTLTKWDTTKIKVRTATSTLKYLSISPSARFNTPIPNLFLLGGLDIELLLSQQSRYGYRFQNGGEITDQGPFKFSDLKTRFGGHIGVGYDIYVADMWHKVRVNFTPYLTINFGTAVIGDNGSTVNNVLVRLGMTVKFGRDHIKLDTLPFDPNFKVPDIILATLDRKQLVSFKVAESKPLILSASWDLVKKPQFEEQLSLETSIYVLETVRQAIINEFSEKQDIVIREKDKSEGKKELVPEKVTFQSVQKKVMTYAKSSDTRLTEGMKEYLDNVGAFLIENPKHKLAIIGHSDDAGTIDENTARSNQRAQEVKKYLMKKGIPESRLFVSGRGSLVPVAENTTEVGRKRNRRVEVEVIQPGKDPFKAMQSGGSMKIPGKTPGKKK